MVRRKFIVTAGPTREWLDPVRFMSNPSSGKMGFSIADAASIRGYDVVCIHGPVHESLLEGRPYRLLSVESTSEMLQAVLNELEARAVLVMSAAPADYTPVTTFRTKIKKGASNITVEFKRTPDILREVMERCDRGDFPGIYRAGFAAETESVADYAQKKLAEKKLDVIFGNDVSRDDSGFAVDTSDLTAYFPSGESLQLGFGSKTSVAKKIIELIEEELESRP